MSKLYYIQRADSRVREDEILYVMRHLVTLRLWPEDGSAGQEANGTRTPLSGGKTSPRAHLFRSYPLLLELAFVPAHLPSMWILPSEHRVLFCDDERRERDAEGLGSRKGSLAAGAEPSGAKGGEEGGDQGEKGEDEEDDDEENEDDGVESESDESDEDAGDGSDLIEVSVRDLARRALELVGLELGLGAGL